MAMTAADTALTMPATALRNIGATLLAKAGVANNYRKIFAVGMNKTATMSIHEVFIRCGLRATHSVRWRRTHAAIEHATFQAFSDGPPDDFRRLDQRFPNSLFILNTRDLTEWLDSRLEHLHHEAVDGQVRRSGYWSPTDAGLDTWVRHRNLHHLAVLRHFADRPDKLLVVNYIRDPSAARRIAAFVGADAPQDKPNVQSLPTGREPGKLRNAAMIGRCLDRLGVPRSEWSSDLFCRSLAGGDATELPADTSELVR